MVEKSWGGSTLTGAVPPPSVRIEVEWPFVNLIDLKYLLYTGSRTKVRTIDSTTRTNHFHPGPIFLLSLFSVLGSLETSASSCHVPEVINAQIGRNGRFR